VTRSTPIHILLIVRHYPPEVSGGARRPLTFVEAMRARGYRVTIVSPFETDDPDHVHVFNAPIARGAQAQLLASVGASHPGGPVRRAKDWLRRWAYWPDPNIGWARAVAAHPALRLLTPDIVMTSSPPESSHFAGMRLSRHWGVPWLAEFRDSWIHLSHRAELNGSALRRWCETQLARRWLRNASAIVGVSGTVLTDIRALVPNGLREVEIGHFAPPPPKGEPLYILPDDRLNLVHSGGFSASDPKRSLKALLGQISVQTPLSLPLCLHLAGPLSPAEHDAIRASSVDVRHHGLLNLVQSRQLQTAADALLLCIPEGSHAVPGKLAEYWQTRKPILRFGYSDWIKSFPPGALPELGATLGLLRKGLAAPDRAEMFSLPHAIDQYDSLIVDLLSQRE